MARYYKLNRAIEVADYISEGHTIAEAAKEFGCGTSTIKRDINLLGVIAFYDKEDDIETLKKKYLSAKKVLDQNVPKRATSN